MIVAALLLQAAPIILPDRADLPTLATHRCPAGPAQNGDVVVCGRRTDQRLGPLPEQPARDPRDRLTWRLPGGGTANLHAIQTYLPGATGQGAALTLSVPFGKRGKKD